MRSEKRRGQAKNHCKPSGFYSGENGEQLPGSKQNRDRSGVHFNRVPLAAGPKPGCRGQGWRKVSSGKVSIHTQGLADRRKAVGSRQIRIHFEGPGDGIC